MDCFVASLLAMTTLGATPAPQRPELVQVGKVHAAGLVGLAVTDGAGHVVGDVVNVLVDAQGKPQAVVIEFAGFLGVGNRDVAVDWGALRFSVVQGSVAVSETLDANDLKALPVYAPAAPSVPVALPPHGAKKPS